MNYEDRVTKEYVEGLLAGLPKIATGSYVGTGVYGRGNNTSITFDFVPKLVLVSTQSTGMRINSNNSTWGPCFFWFPGTGTQSVKGYSTTSVGSIELTLSDCTLRWFSTSSADVQLNQEGLVYYYVAIG